MALTWSGSFEDSWTEEEEEKSMATMRALLQAETLAKDDAAFEDLQRQLHTAVMQVEEGRAREAALLRRAEKSEAAEEALAFQIADIEAEAFACITQAKKLSAVPHQMEPGKTSQISMQVDELTSRLQVALEEAAAWARRCQDLEKEAEERGLREAAFQRQAEMAEAAEEALASQIGELEAEAFAYFTKNTPLLVGCINETEPPIAGSRVEELEKRLADAEEELEAVRAKLRHAEEKSRWQEMRAVVQQVLEAEEEEGTMKSGDDTMLSVSVNDLAGVKVKLWNPSSLALTSH